MPPILVGMNLNLTQMKPLKAAGALYFIGDVALGVSEIMKGEYKGAAGALMYGLGGLTTARYGNPSAEKKLELLTARITKNLDEQGIALPETGMISREELAKEGGFVHTVENLLYQYPSQVMNTFFAVGGGQMIAGGMSPNKPGVARDYYKAGAGALVMAGALTGLFIQEKKQDPNHTPTGPVDKLKHWVEEKPLRTTGLLYNLNNIVTLKSALDERKNYRASEGVIAYSYIPKLVMVGTYAIANILLGKSSKQNSKASDEDKAFYEALEQAAAGVVNAQPPALQAQVLQQVAGYLAAQPEVHISGRELAKGMEERLQELHTQSIQHTQSPSR